MTHLDNQADEVDGVDPEDLGLLDPDDVESIMAAAVGAADDVIDIDLSEAPKSPEGDFELEVLDIEVRFTKNGQRQAVVYVQIVTPGPDMGRKFTESYMLQGKGTGFTRDFLAAIGQLGEGDRVQLTVKEARGARFRATVGPDDSGWPEVRRPKPLG
jgi:hypothetical protein